MKPYKAKTVDEALTLQALMHKQGVACDLYHMTLTFANVKAWNKVKKQWAAMLLMRKAAESKSMMIDNEFDI